SIVRGPAPRRTPRRGAPSHGDGRKFRGLVARDGRRGARPGGVRRPEPRVATPAPAGRLAGLAASRRPREPLAQAYGLPPEGRRPYAHHRHRRPGGSILARRMVRAEPPDVPATRRG